MEQEYERLLTKVGTLYYVDDVSQNIIAEKLGLSKSKVCRIIAEAKRCGIVQISISSSQTHNARYERKLEKLFGLREAIVVQPTGVDTLEDVGKAGANYLQRIIRDNDIIGVSWGRTLLSIINKMAPIRAGGVKVVQLVGGLNSRASQTQPSELAMRLAQACSTTAELLYCPAKAYSVSVKQGLMSDVMIGRVSKLGQKSTIALVGIGTISPQSELFVSGYVNTQQMQGLQSSGAVGDVCMRFYDRDGKETENELRDLTMSISMEDLKTINNVVCTCAGTEKAEALLGVLRGGIVNTLITDRDTAKEVLKICDKNGEEHS